MNTTDVTNWHGRGQQQSLIIHGLHSEWAVSNPVIYSLWAPVCNPWCVAACGGSVLICEREFEKGSVSAVYDGKRAVSVIFIAAN
jgi:hypothetical protein